GMDERRALDPVPCACRRVDPVRPSRADRPEPRLRSETTYHLGAPGRPRARVWHRLHPRRRRRLAGTSAAGPDERSGTLGRLDWTVAHALNSVLVGRDWLEDP